MIPSIKSHINKEVLERDNFSPNAIILAISFPEMSMFYKGLQYTTQHYAKKKNISGANSKKLAHEEIYNNMNIYYIYDMNH